MFRTLRLLLLSPEQVEEVYDDYGDDDDDEYCDGK